MALPGTLTEFIERNSALATPSQARLQALYTFTFTQQQSNPAGYEANIKWWSNVFEESLRDGFMNASSLVTTKGQWHGETRQVGFVDRLSFEVAQESLLKTFECKSGQVSGTGRPKGLACVISAETEKRPAVYMNETAFLSSPSALGQSESLASKYIVAPLWKSLSQLNPFGSSSHETDDESRIWKRYQHTRLVHLGLVEEAATAFISKMITDPPTEHSASLFTPAIFQSRYSLSLLASHMDIAKSNTEQLYLGLSERDCKILLRYLARDKEVLVADEDGKCYKMVPQFGDAFETQVNEADRGTIAIIQTIDKLERQIEAIHQEMKGAQEKAASYLKSGQKPLALSYLRSKKQLDGVLEKRVGTCEQLKTVLRSIDQAHGDVEIMKVYQTSSKTLKSVLSNPLLDRDHVDATMDDLGETLADQREIDEAIQAGGQLAATAGGALEVDQDELEKELDMLVKAEAAAAEPRGNKPSQEVVVPETEAEKRAERLQDEDAGGEVEARLAKLRPTNELEPSNESTEHVQETRQPEAAA